MFNTKSYTSIDEFLEDNLSFLEKEEAVNNLIIGIALSFKNKPEEASQLFLASVFKNERPILTCLQTPPRNLLLNADEKLQIEAIDAFIPFLLKSKIQAPGVVAVKSLATAFAEKWCTLNKCDAKITFEQLIYRLDQVEDLEYAAGKLRKATDNDLDVVSNWMFAFAKEALNEEDRLGAEKSAKSKIQEESLYLWENQNQIVSMVAASRPTRRGITINYVYTPPEHRKKGYASACVAELSKLMLKDYQFCSLYTDLSNPTSNKIYAAIGYREIKESRQIEFS